jgi:hypothetical protein
MEQMQQWLQTPSSAVPESTLKTANTSACNNGLCCGPSRVPQSSPANNTTKGAAAAAGTGGGCCPTPCAVAGAPAACAPAPTSAAGGAAKAGSSCCRAGMTHHLVAYPAKDNYEGRIYPLEWVEQVHLPLLLAGATVSQQSRCPPVFCGLPGCACWCCPASCSCCLASQYLISLWSGVDC